MMDTTTKLVTALAKSFNGITVSRVTDGFGGVPSKDNNFLYNEFRKAFTGIAHTADSKYEFTLERDGDDWQFNLYDL